MKIELKQVAVREIVKNFKDNGDKGITGLDGKLDIRPAYQREFVYDDKKRNAVINTLYRNLPLNIMYWVENEDGSYEVLDGQQRTISICQFVNGDFSYKGKDLPINEKYFFNLTDDEQEKILDYKCLVEVITDGTDSDKLDWFRTINTAGEILSEQELRNINYTGAWLSDAKEFFSKRNCTATRISNGYVNGSDIRQELLETALIWIAGGKDNIENYMALHQHDDNADELKEHFKKVINWVKETFGIGERDKKNYRKEMKGLDWGRLYDKYHDNTYDPEYMESRVSTLMANEEVTEKKGVYEYVLGGEDEDLACKLSKRTFSNTDKRTVYEKQHHRCAITGVELPIEEMEADHIIPWWKGGTTTLDNLQMISKTANKRKSGK